MFPLRDHRPTYKIPVITYLIISINIVVFVAELTASDPEAFINSFALIPSNVNFASPITFLPFITSQFLHAGIVHIVSNLWFLRIFGDNVEEKFGSFFYTFVYLLSGVIAAFTQYLFSPLSDIPMLGASGAVAGVLGAYLVFFPKHQIETLVPMGYFSRVVNVPASFILVYWFITQLFSGVGSIAYAQVGGVAFWAHVGGFATGWIIARFSKKKGPNDVVFEGYDYLS